MNPRVRIPRERLNHPHASTISPTIRQSAHPSRPKGDLSGGKTSGNPRLGGSGTCRGYSGQPKRRLSVRRRSEGPKERDQISLESRDLMRLRIQIPMS